MLGNKRQHFVPQNYLEEFSADGESVGVLITKIGQCVDKPAPICSLITVCVYIRLPLKLRSDTEVGKLPTDFLTSKSFRYDR